MSILAISKQLVIHILEKYIFLGSCIFCKSHYAGVVCKSCERFLHTRNHHTCKMCEVCGVRLTSEERICVSCRNVDHGTICRIHSLWSYNIYTRKIIQCYKKDGNKLLGFYLAKQYYHFFLEVIAHNKTRKEDVIIIPMPANPQHVRITGYDHMKYMCRYISMCDANFRIISAISRMKSNEQKTLDAEQRKINMKKSLVITKKGKKDIMRAYEKTTCIILLDDIVTTGATIFSAYELIKEQIPHIDTHQIYAMSLVRNEY